MKKLFQILLLAVVVSLPISAQVDRSVIPTAGPAPEIKIGDYQSFELPNGLKVFVVENEKLPRIVFQLAVDTDALLEGDAAGYVSAAGELMRTGTASKTKDQLDEAIDFIGANITTSSTSVFASGLSKHTEEIAQLMAEIVTQPNFTQPELDKIKKQMKSNLAVEKDDPNAIAGKVRRAFLFGKKHPYGEIMTEETVENISIEKCREYYDTYFRPNISYLAIVGDIDFDDAKELVEKYFGPWVKKDVPKNKVKNVRAPLVRKVEVVDRPNAVQSVVYISYPVKLKPGTDDAIKASLLNSIFGGSATARLFKNLREDKGYTYGAYSTIAPDKNVGSFSANAQVRNSVTDSSVTEFLSEMKKIRSEGVTQEELDRAKMLLTGRFSRSLEQPQTVANFAINIERYGLAKDFYKNYLKNLNSVTLNDIKKTAKKFIKPNNAHVIIVGNADEISDGLKSFSVSGKIEYYDNYANPVDMAAKKLPAGLTVDMVIDKYITALGGREAIEKITDVTIKMGGTVQGMDVSITMYKKAPNKFFMDLDVGGGMMKQTQKFDGVRAKSSGMGQEKELEGDQLEEMKMGAQMNDFLDFAKYGITTELTGVEKVGGKDAYKIVLTMPSGKKKTEYYDAESGLKVKEVSVSNTPQGEATVSVEYGDYKEVGGMQFAHSITQQMGPMNIPMKVSSVEVNTGLEDSLFEIK